MLENEAAVVLMKMDVRLLVKRGGLSFGLLIGDVWVVVNDELSRRMVGRVNCRVQVLGCRCRVFCRVVCLWLWVQARGLR